MRVLPAKYAYKYKYPQVFCLDGAELLLLQVRITEFQDILDENLALGFWVFSTEKKLYASISTADTGLEAMPWPHGR